MKLQAGVNSDIGKIVNNMSNRKMSIMKNSENHCGKRMNDQNNVGAPTSNHAARLRVVQGKQYLARTNPPYR